MGAKEEILMDEKEEIDKYDFIEKKRVITPENDNSMISNKNKEQNKHLLLTGKIILKIIFNRRISTLTLFILEMVHLIYIGHLKLENQSVYPYTNFNYFLIANYFTYFFSVFFLLGFLKALKDKNIKLYLDSKIIILIFCIVISLPIQLFSYLILSAIYNQSDEIKNNLWNIYINYLVYTPIIILFFSLFQQNIIFLKRNRQKLSSFLFEIIFILVQSLLSYILVYIANLQFKGISFSLIITTFIFYFISNFTVNEDIFKKEKSNFYLFPKIITIKSFCDKQKEEEEHLKRCGRSALYTFLDFLIYSLFLFICFFYKENDLSVFICLLNFFNITHSITLGIELKMQSFKEKMIEYSCQFRDDYNEIFTIIVVFFALIFCLIIFAFKKNFMSFYLSNPSQEIKNIYLNNYLILILIIFLEFIFHECEGYIKGINSNIPNWLPILKASLAFIFVPVGCVISFKFGFGIQGFLFMILLNNAIYNIPVIIEFIKDKKSGKKDKKNNDSNKIKNN